MMFIFYYRMTLKKLKKTCLIMIDSAKSEWNSVIEAVRYSLLLKSVAKIL